MTYDRSARRPVLRPAGPDHPRPGSMALPLLVLQQGAGNRAVTQLLQGSHPTVQRAPVVQRAAIVLADGTIVPGTAAENTSVFAQYLVHAEWTHLDTIIGDLRNVGGPPASWESRARAALEERVIARVEAELTAARVDAKSWELFSRLPGREEFANVKMLLRELSKREAPTDGNSPTVPAKRTRLETTPSNGPVEQPGDPSSGPVPVGRPVSTVDWRAYAGQLQGLAPAVRKQPLSADDRALVATVQQQVEALLAGRPLVEVTMGEFSEKRDFSFFRTVCDHLKRIDRPSAVDSHNGIDWASAARALSSTGPRPSAETVAEIGRHVGRVLQGRPPTSPAIGDEFTDPANYRQFGTACERLSALSSVVPTGGQPGTARFALGIVTDNELLGILVENLPYAQLRTLMLVSRQAWRQAAKRIGAQFGVPEPTGSWPLGVVKVVARFTAGGSLFTGSSSLLDSLRHEASARAALGLSEAEVEQFVQAVGWREFRRGSPATRPRVSIHSFAQHTLSHLRITQVLTLTPSITAAARYPTGAYYGTPAMDQQLKFQLATHWLELYRRIGEAEPQPLDTSAKSAADTLGAHSHGHNITVTADGRPTEAELSVHSNRALDPATAGKSLQPPFRLTPESTSAGRVGRGPEHGVGRAFYYKRGGVRVVVDLPFHSELVRIGSPGNLPWELRYAGNIYNACVQCMAAYHALGVKHGQASEGGVYRGSHGAKVPAVIPPMIRGNSVYLQHYVGEGVWNWIKGIVQRFIDLTPPGHTPQPAALAPIVRELKLVFEFLDAAERFHTDFYKSSGHPDGPTTTH